MSQSTLEKLGCNNEVRTMLENVGIYHFTFNPHPTSPSLVYEFLSSYCLRVQYIIEQNPLNSIRFRLGGRDRFLTSQSIDEEPAWVGGFFDRLFIVESNFNTMFNQVDTRLNHFEHRMDHMEYENHQLYAHHNIQCTWPHPPPLF